MARERKTLNGNGHVEQILPTLQQTFHLKADLKVFHNWVS